MKRQPIYRGFVLFMLAFLLAACGGDDEQPAPEGGAATDTGATTVPVANANETPVGPSTGETAAPTTEAPEPAVTAVDPTATPAPADAGAGGITETASTTILTQHTVQEREWLHQIARCYGTSAQDIVVANNLPHPGWIMAGEVWQIPNVGSVDSPIGPPCIIFYHVKGGDTLSSIARTYSVPVEALVFANYGCYGYNAHYDYVPGGPNYYGYGSLGGCTYYGYPTIYVGELLVIPVNAQNAGLR